VAPWMVSTSDTMDKNLLTAEGGTYTTRLNQNGKKRGEPRRKVLHVRGHRQQNNELEKSASQNSRRAIAELDQKGG